MALKTYEVGSDISVEVRGQLVKAFQVLSVDKDKRATSLRSNGTFVLSEALNKALKETGATSAWADHDDYNIIHLNNGHREDSPFYKYAMDFDNDQP